MVGGYREKKPWREAGRNLHLQEQGADKCLVSLAPGPGTVDSQGQIEFLACYATLKTKSQTKFYLEFHSSCLESKWLATPPPRGDSFT